MLVQPPDSKWCHHERDAARRAWTSLSDTQLLAQCAVDTYRASGPGGQKRNKTSSAVRLRHLPSGLSVIAEESRSQHENRAQALRGLRQRLYLKLREPLAPKARRPRPWPRGRTSARRGTGAADCTWAQRPALLARGRRRAGRVAGAGRRVAEAAAALGTRTANLIDFLQADDKVWQEANQMRQPSATGCCAELRRERATSSCLPRPGSRGWRSRCWRRWPIRPRRKIASGCGSRVLKSCCR